MHTPATCLPALPATGPYHYGPVLLAQVTLKNKELQLAKAR